jgi:hypothetical protein
MATRRSLNTTVELSTRFIKTDPANDDQRGLPRTLLHFLQLVHGRRELKPASWNNVPLEWGFTYKFGTDGYLTKLKAQRAESL